MHFPDWHWYLRDTWISGYICGVNVMFIGGVIVSMFRKKK